MKNSFNLRNALTTAFAVAALAAASGCGGSTPDAKGPGGKSGPVDHAGNSVSAAAAGKFKSGQDAMVRYDKSGWNEAACREVAQTFLAAQSEQDKFFAPAVYNAGVAFQRCGLKADAKKQYEEVLSKDAAFHRARVQLALFAFEDGGEKDIEKAIGEMKRAVADSKFQNVEALVNQARLEMKRGNNTSDADGANDYERAKKNLQRALAVEDAYMPAFNQLAIYYLEVARIKAGQKKSSSNRRVLTSKVDTQALELAALVCSQAIQKNPSYAAVHNTAGLISVELGNLNAAVESFGRARKLDPNFFEAHMNYASVNMRFRGFPQAEEAYKQAIRVRPNDYDAHLGLALALRGEIDDSNFNAKLTEAQASLDKAKAIDANRPEAYFNDGILTQEYRAKAGDASAEPALKKAIDLFKQFAAKAQGKAEFADAVEDVTAVPTKTDAQCTGKGSRNDKACKKGRIKEIEEIIAFNKQTAEDKKKMEQEMKQMEAEAEAAGANAPAE
jgi:tetratricopeptide (TPR) repeat protein